MSKIAILLCALLTVFLGPRAFADIAAVHTSALPQESAVLASLSDAIELEPYTRLWTQNWNYPVTKAEAAAHLGVDLASLNSAVKSHPGNAELLLLTGLVARYAYNVDVPGSYDASIGALAEAEKLNTADIRAPWFRATLLCQTSQPKAGADGFLAIEEGQPWERLPAAFWIDYMECASVTNMPAHLLRADSHLEGLHASDSEERTFLTDIARKRFDPFDPKRRYAPKEVWEGASAGNDVTFTSTTCGLRLQAQANWDVDQLALTKGSCLAEFSSGPYQGTAHSILVLVRQLPEGETLDELAKGLPVNRPSVPFTPSRCPADRCIALQSKAGCGWDCRVGVRKPEAYGKDGLELMVIFERKEPQFPGLIFESPSQPPNGDGVTGVKYYRPSQTLRRIPGKLYYLILLETATSMEGPAIRDLDFFLQQLMVE